MKYVALLRGTNVGGNSLIKMDFLKRAVEELGFSNVKTYINSGNVIFETNDKDTEVLEVLLEAEFLKSFKFPILVIVLPKLKLEKILKNIPSEWEKRDDIRCYVSFIKQPTTPKEVISQVKLKEGIDFIKVGPNVVYMTTKLSGLTKSGFTKLISQKVYKQMTMRNFNTARKILTLMEQ